MRVRVAPAPEPRALGVGMSRDRDKYIFDVLELERRCYVLLASFLASPRMHQYCRESAGEDATSLVIYEPQVIKSHLIDIAIRLRMIDDAMRAHDRTHHLPPESVGELETSRNAARADMPLREACNKIIHAKSIRLEEAADAPGGHLTPAIKLSGEQNGTPWVATIDVKAFVKAAVFMATKYDEDWDVSAFRE